VNAALISGASDVDAPSAAYSLISFARVAGPSSFESAKRLASATAGIRQVAKDATREGPAAAVSATPIDPSLPWRKKPSRVPRANCRFRGRNRRSHFARRPQRRFPFAAFE